jgi:SAP domain
MARIKYDVRNVEATVFEQPKPGIYPAKLENVELGKSKAGNEQLVIQLRLKSGDYKGALLWHYVPTDEDSPGAFRMVELVKVLGLKPTGTLDTDRIEGQSIQVRVKADSYNGEYRARVGALLPEAEDDEDLSEDEDEPESENGASATKRRTRRAEPEADEDEPEAEEGGEDEDEDADDYDEWEIKELRAELKERGLRTAGNKTGLIKRLREDDGSEDDPFS